MTEADGAKKNICGLILSAGYSKRMGEFKPLLTIGNKPALLRVIEAFKEAGIKDIYVVTGHKRDKLTEIIKATGAVEVYNENYQLGMFESIKTGISRVAKDTNYDGLLLHPVDTPLLESRTIKEFVSAIRKEARPNFAVSCFKGKKGHPLFIPKEFFEEILLHSGERGLKGVTSKYDGLMFRFDAKDESVILDMDTKEAYEEILKFHSEKDQEQGKSVRSLLKKRIILVRHGEISQHKEKIFLGQYDPPLSEKGKSQAAKAGQALSQMSLSTNKLYTSDLKRAKNTGEIIGDILGFDIIEEAGLREMSLGSWDGKYISEIRENYPKEYETRGSNLLTFKIDNESENHYDLRYRVLKSFEKILLKDDHEDLIIVSHGGVIRSLLSILEGKSLESLIKILIKNGEIIVLEGINYELTR